MAADLVAEMRFKTKAALVLVAIVLGYVTTYLAARNSLAHVVHDPSLSGVFSQSDWVPRPDRTGIWTRDEQVHFHVQFFYLRPWDKLRCYISELLFQPLMWVERKAFGHRVKFAPRGI